MEDYEILRMLTRIIFGSPVEDAEEILAPISSIPKCLLTSDFKLKVVIILTIKIPIVSYRWIKFVDVCYSKIFSSHEAYLTFVMFACIREHQRNQNIFDGVISVCALLCFINSETNKKTGVNLSYLNPFIFMKFYDHISDIINRQGGAQRLVEFINGHRYLGSKLVGFFTSPEAIISFKASPVDFKSAITKELKREGVKKEEIDAEEIANDESCLRMAKEVLESCAGIEHPHLPTSEELVRSYVEYRKRQRAERKTLETAVKSAVSKLCLEKVSNSITESKTNDATKSQDNIQQYESVIQAVIRHNHSKNSGHESANNKIQEEANGVLQHLKETVETLTKVVNEFDKD